MHAHIHISCAPRSETSTDRMCCSTCVVKGKVHLHADGKSVKFRGPQNCCTFFTIMHFIIIQILILFLYLFLWVHLIDFTLFTDFYYTQFYIKYTFFIYIFYFLSWSLKAIEKQTINIMKPEPDWNTTMCSLSEKFKVCDFYGCTISSCHFLSFP